jgi:hypothetical protein
LNRTAVVSLLRSLHSLYRTLQGRREATSEVAFFRLSFFLRRRKKLKIRTHNKKLEKKLLQDAGEAFFVWFNSTHMHFRTHAKPEELLPKKKRAKRGAAASTSGGERSVNG